MRAAAFVLFLAVSSIAHLAAKAPFTFDALATISRIDDPQLSPDGKMLAFTVQTVDLSANTKPTHVYLVSIDGGTPLRLTNDGTSNVRPRWAPDSKHIFFVSDRPNPSAANTSQVWSMAADGSDVRQVTTLPTGAEGVTVSPDGNLLIFTSDIYPGCEPSNAVAGIGYDAACNKANLDKEADSKMHARVYTSLLYRHWTQYQGSRRRHLLIQTLNAGKVRDLTPGPADAPPFSLGGPEPYVFSPDSIQIAYVGNNDSDLSTSTNSDIFLVPSAGGAPKQLTFGKGGDEGPLFSPDGKLLAFRTQARAGYEGDLWRLAVLDLQTNALTSLTDALDRWVETYTWSADSKRLFFTIDDHGSNPLMMIAAGGGGGIRTIAQGPTSITSMQFTPGDKVLVYAEQSGSRPVEIYKATSKGGSGVALTHLNDDVINNYQLTPLERITVDGQSSSKVESFIVKPPDFDAARKYPVLFLIHGGPQGDWGETWSYRWNAQVFAAAGYVVVMPNPQGSVGYGQAFTDAVNGDWGGRAYQSIMATVNAVSALPYVDSNRMAAAGGSYGGYMIDWLLGHTENFKAFVSHAGVFDLVSEAGATEELWFPKWEFHGFPWENAGMYERWSPSSFITKFKTPTLVTHGELDYRVPINQGQALFTALQQMKVPSKMVQFPDEGHWILKPQNSQFWYQTVIDWINQYTKSGS